MKKQALNIILCRHGETEWTVSGQHTSYTDIPLTPKGRNQAEHLGQRLKKTEFQSIFTSPLQRARATCELAGFSKKMVLEPDAVEWNYGAFEGLTSEEIGKKHPEWNLFRDGAPKGESPSEIGARADRLIQIFLLQRGNIALFSHGHFLRVLAARWIGLDSSSAKLFSLSVASLSILGFERRQRVVHLWNSQE